MKKRLPQFRQPPTAGEFCPLQSLPLHTPLKAIQSDQLTWKLIMEDRKVFCRRARPRAPMSRRAKRHRSPTTDVM